jgi:hypothetical protein
MKRLLMALLIGRLLLMVAPAIVGALTGSRSTQQQRGRGRR